jgi:anti-sigma factor RsiW
VRTQRGPSHLARALLAFAADRRGVEPWRVDALAGRPVTVRRLGPRAAVSLAALAALTVAGGVATSAVGHGPAELAAGLFG